MDTWEAAVGETDASQMGAGGVEGRGGTEISMKVACSAGVVDGGAVGRGTSAGEGRSPEMFADIAVKVDIELSPALVESKKGGAAGWWWDKWAETDYTAAEGARVRETAGATAAAGVVEQLTVVRRWSSRTRLTVHDSVAELGLQQALLRALSGPGDSQLLRGGTRHQLTSMGTRQNDTAILRNVEAAERARTEKKKGRSGGRLKGAVRIPTD